jgi:hypothetical protein
MEISPMRMILGYNKVISHHLTPLTILKVKHGRSTGLSFCRLNGIRPINWPYLLLIKWHRADQLAFPFYRLNGIPPINWPPQKADLIASG